MTKIEILKNSTEKITLKKYSENVQLVPSSATVSIVDGEGSALPTAVAAAACLIDSYGTISYAMLAANTATLGENFRATFSYVISGVTYTDIVYFDIVLKRLNSLVTDKDLVNEFSVIGRIGYRIFGEVTTLVSAATSVVDNERLNGELNEYKGGIFEVLSGNAEGFACSITAFNETTRTLTLAKSLTTPLAVGDKFLVRQSFKKEIERAFEELTDFIRTQGFRPALITDDTQLREAHIAMAIAKILLPLGDAHRYEYEEYRKKAGDMKEALKLTYDTDEDGTVDDDEPDQNPAPTRLRR